MTLVQQTVARQESVVGSASDCPCVLAPDNKKRKSYFIVSPLCIDLSHCMEVGFTLHGSWIQFAHR
jgi:hypothetical protein